MRSSLRAAIFGASYLPESLALFAAMTTPPSDGRKALIDRTIRVWKDGGFWARADIIYVTAAHDRQAGRVNWKAPTLHALTEVQSASLTFETDRGFTGNGTTSYLTGPNMLTFGGMYALNDAHMAVWTGTHVAANNTDVGIGNAFIRSNNNTANTVSLRGNDGTTSSLAVGSNAIGHTLWTRSASTGYDVYKNGASSGSIVMTSTSINSQTFGVCAQGNGANFNTRRQAAAHFGASLTAAQIAAAYAGLSLWMTGVGAP